VSKVDTAVVVTAFPELGPLFDDPAAIGRSLPVAVALTASDYPSAVDDYTDTIGSWLGNPNALAREAAVSALVTVGRETPTALAPALESLLDHADNAIEVAQLSESKNDPPEETDPGRPVGSSHQRILPMRPVL